MTREPAGTDGRDSRRTRLMNDKEQERGDSTREDQARAVRRPVPEVRPRKEQRFSWIWLVPLLAVLVGGGLLARDWMAVGPKVVISFDSAEGIEAGQTRVRYKDVAVGTVTDVKVDHAR